MALLGTEANTPVTISLDKFGIEMNNQATSLVLPRQRRKISVSKNIKKKKNRKKTAEGIPGILSDLLF